MQSRQLNRRQYFNELATTSEKYFIPYIQQYMQVGKGTNVLEIGCGDGGNLLPFSRMGCNVVGVDMAKGRIRDARKFFQENGAKGRFIASNVFLVKELKYQFDLIVCHDVIEHITDKEGFMRKCKKLLKYRGGGGDFNVLYCVANAIRWATTKVQKSLP
ncbi:methyltransferase domain-containing protein, partial [Prevotella koreensis]|uniref:class I SAM-dependent methyltransferase n=1 Tax=Prevotella koreensis TaxID=2490854 RepID=UPI0028E6FE97